MWRPNQNCLKNNIKYTELKNHLTTHWEKDIAFFFDKLGYISDRYDALCSEMLNRGFKCNRIPKEDLHQGLEQFMFWGYTPTTDALAINRARIAERLGVMA